MTAELKEKIVAFLAGQEHLALATVSAEGVPMAHTISYVSDGTHIYFMTDKKTRKATNIAANPRVSCALYDTAAEMMSLQALQMEGTAALVTDQGEFGKMLGAYLAKFPFLKDMPPNPDMMMYRIVPGSATFLDNSLGFGHVDPIEF